jgi:hypothetical protein
LPGHAERSTGDKINACIKPRAILFKRPDTYAQNQIYGLYGRLMERNSHAVRILDHKIDSMLDIYATREGARSEKLRRSTGRFAPKPAHSPPFCYNRKINIFNFDTG